jgi:serine/threonine-protein kinase
MQPFRDELDKPPPSPLAMSATHVPDEDPTPHPVGPESEERSFESLGSTRVIPGQAANVPAPSDAASDADNPRIESRLHSAKEPATLGDYRLLHKIGEGAMGAVWKARPGAGGREVALKVLFPHIANNPKLVERMDREGRVMGRLDHPNIVQAYGIGEDQGWHFIALEYIDGLSMQKWLAKLDRLSVGDALYITIRCARALDYAHREGVVHRDIKPDNILINSKGEVKVADLGMVKTDDQDMSLTQTGHAVGTPWYMPLEQAKNAKETDGRSDIYALGCMLYCFLTGAPPFAGKTLLEVIRAKELGTFPPARQTNSEVPERVDLIIYKMTQKRPNDRYRTCAELLTDLEALGLASARLSFLDETKPQPTAAPETKAPSSYPDEPSPVTHANIWFVRYRDEDGRTQTRRMSTGQVQKLLEEDLLAPNAKASHHPSEGFRSLATYREFQGLALVKASQQKSGQQSARYEALVKEFDAKAEQPKEEKMPIAVAPPEWLPLALKIGGGVIGFIVALWLISRLF